MRLNNRSVLLLVASVLLMAGCSHAPNPRRGTFVSEHSLLLQPSQIPAGSNRLKPGQFLVITLSEPSKGKVNPNCVITTPHVRPIDDDLIVFVRQSNETWKAIWSINYDSKTNKPGQLFEFKYDDVKYKTAFQVKIVLRNTDESTGDSNAMFEYENRTAFYEHRECNHCSLGIGECDVAEFTADPSNP